MILIRKLIFIVILTFVGVAGLYAQRKIENTGPTKEKVEDISFPSGVQLSIINPEVIIRVGDVFWYSARVHGFIGNDYELEYDEEAFDMRCQTLNDRTVRNSKKLSRSGSDVKRSVFTAKKPGEYEIKVMNMNQTKVKKVTTYKIIVFDGVEGGDACQDGTVDTGISDLRR